MVFIKKNESTLKQEAYARRVWSADGESKHDIALDVGFSESVAHSPKQKIEERLGFRNAIAVLAEKSNDIGLKVLTEFEDRDLKDYSNKDLNSTLNAITNSVVKFNPKQEETPSGTGRLRQVILQRIENQQNITTINNEAVDLDF